MEFLAEPDYKKMYEILFDAQMEATRFIVSGRRKEALITLEDALLESGKQYIKKGEMEVIFPNEGDPGGKQKEKKLV